MVNEEFTCIHIFVDERFVDKLKSIWEEKLLQLSVQPSNDSTNSSFSISQQRQRIRISPLSDSHLGKEDKLIIVFNPNNVVEYEGSTVNVLDEVQALSFHGNRNSPDLRVLHDSL